MAVKTYDPKEVIFTYGGNLLTGFGPGTAITAERREDMWSMQIGVDGEGTRSKSNDKSATISLFLMQSSDANEVLSALALVDEASSASALPLMIKDNSGNTLLLAETAWIKKMPTVEYSTEAGPREWVFETDTLVMNVAGN